MLKLNLQHFADANPAGPNETPNEDHHPIAVGDTFKGDDRSHSELLNINGWAIFAKPKYTADKTALQDIPITDFILADY